MAAPGPEGQENVVFLAGRRAAAPPAPSASKAPASSAPPASPANTASSSRILPGARRSGNAGRVQSLRGSSRLETHLRAKRRADLGRSLPASSSSCANSARARRPGPASSPRASSSGASSRSRSGAAAFLRISMSRAFLSVQPSPEKSLSYTVRPVLAWPYARCLVTRWKGDSVRPAGLGFEDRARFRRGRGRGSRAPSTSSASSPSGVTFRREWHV